MVRVSQYDGIKLCSDIYEVRRSGWSCSYRARLSRYRSLKAATWCSRDDADHLKLHASQSLNMIDITLRITLVVLDEVSETPLTGRPNTHAVTTAGRLFG